MRRTALDAYIARKAEIDTVLTRLKALSDNHFNVGPDAVDWPCPWPWPFPTSPGRSA